MNQSYWQKTSKKTIEKRIETDISTDIVIIGGGLSGLALAYQLKDSPYRVIVLDKDELGSHTSGHTTAKITTLHALHYQKIVQHYDIHQAYLYYKSNEDALSQIKEIIQKENIQCQFQENESYIYTDDPQYVPYIEREKEIFDLLRVPTKTLDTHLSSLGLEHQGIFHPLQYLYALIRICKEHGVCFYEHSEVKHIERKNQQFVLNVNGKQIHCLYLVHATRYPFIKKGLYFLKLFQQKEYVDFVDHQKTKNSLLCVDQTVSYRPISETNSLSIQRDSKDWFAQDSIALRGIPYIGRLDPQSNEFVIYGFQKWGMTLSQVAGKLIADLILERDNPYEELYSCHYFSMSYAKPYYAKLWENTKRGMILNHFQNHSIQALQCQSGIVTRVHGKLRAVYKDKKGELHYFSPYCPHLKCIVEFVEKDQTWTCPCHQSVYDAYGKLIEGPSLFSLQKKDIDKRK
jgi:FAD dependent oxidoreductase./Rieske [2Fe-2S] domain.